MYTFKKEGKDDQVTTAKQSPLAPWKDDPSHDVPWNQFPTT